MKTFLGIDPGKSGAVAVIWPDGCVSLYDLNESLHDTWETMLEICAEGDEYIAALEDVHASPQMGVTGAFNFGGCARAIEMALVAAGVRYQRVSPAKWKKAIFDADLYPRGLAPAEQKQAARDMARRLYPQVASQLTRVKDADRAEALLIARYAQMREG